MNIETAPAVRGRPREFCVDEALTAALRVFWRHGFEGASMNDRTEAMGITRPSLYAAFGNKESLFHKALDLYERDKLAYVGEALAATTARGVAERLLRGGLDLVTNPADPKGCLGVISMVACGVVAESIKADVMARRASSDAAMLARFERAKAEGDFPEHIEPASLQRYLSAVLQGMSVQGGAGATRAQLESLVETTLALWPGR
jgi:AcrR family transcriptional regulator